jgi:plasmid maintenance system antidote protein VapI
MSNTKIAAATAELDDLSKLFDSFTKTLAASKFGALDEFTKARTALQGVVDVSSTLAKIQEEQAIHGRKAVGYTSDQLGAFKRQLQYGQKQLKLAQSNLKLEEKVLHGKYAELKAQEKINNLTNKQKKELSDINKSLNQNTADQDKFAKSIEDSKSEMEDLSIQSLKVKMKEMGSAGMKFGEKIAQTVPVVSSLLNPLELIGKLVTEVVTAFKEVDKEIGAASKSLNMTYDQVGDMRIAMAAYAGETGEALINSQKMLDTFVKLNSALGVSLDFAQLTPSLKADVAFLSMMEHYAGLTAEETQGIFKYSLALGKPAKEVATSMMGQYRAAGLTHGVVLNEKDVLKEIATTSDYIKLSTEGGAAGFAKMLGTVKALGFDMASLESATSGLLNFEDSIEKEMQAELLLGKDLNLEKARQFALDNDRAGLAEELKNQLGSQAEFLAYNNMQQQSLADALGMSKDQIAETLMGSDALTEASSGQIDAEQAKLASLTSMYGVQEGINVLAQQQLDIQNKQVSAQERLDSNMQKVRDTQMPGIVGTLKTINSQMDEWFKKLTDLLKHLDIIKGVLIGIGVIIALKVVKGVFDFISGASAAIKFLKEIRVLEKINAGIAIVRGSWASLGPLGPTGPFLAAGAIAAGMAGLYAVMNDGIISPSTGGSGYGSRVLHGPEGAISFNNKDTIVAGTNLFPEKVNDMTSSPAGTNSLGGSGLAKEMNALTTAIMALASRPIDVSIDGKRVIQATTGANPNEAGAASAINSFALQ